MIKLKNEYFEVLLNNKELLDGIRKKDFPMKVGYWINKGMTKAFDESKHYQSEKEKLVTKYAKKYDEDGENHKAGDPIIQPNGGVIIEDIPSFNKDFSELLNIEVEIEGANEVEIDFEDKNLPKLSIEEQRIIEPFVKPKE